MTEMRAHEIDPSVTTGIAVSTTWVHGDCTAVPPPKNTPVCGDENLACARVRAPLRVLLVPVNTSVPTSMDCPQRFVVAELAMQATLDQKASAQGELVVEVGAGRYTIYISSDDRCASCGVVAVGSACTIDVAFGQLTVRDLVLDESTH
jgi:hypothetical protein